MLWNRSDVRVLWGPGTDWPRPTDRPTDRKTTNNLRLLKTDWEPQVLENPLRTYAIIKTSNNLWLRKTD